MTNGDKPPARIRSLKGHDGKLQSHLEWPNGRNYSAWQHKAAVVYTAKLEFL